MDASRSTCVTSSAAAASRASRYRLDGGAWSEWMTASELASIDVGDAAEIDVEAEDEEGNVAETHAGPHPRSRSSRRGAGCGCVVAGADRTNGSPRGSRRSALLGVALRFGRRRAAKVETDKPVEAPRKAARSEELGAPRARALTGLVVIGRRARSAATDCSDEQTAGAQLPCDAPACTTLSRASSAPTRPSRSRAAPSGSRATSRPTGTTATSGAISSSASGTGRRSTWSVIDGVPAEPAGRSPLLYNKNGFRGGQTEPGDDVGLWTSIAIDGAGNPAVAYYDRTNKALKFAQSAGRRVERDPRSRRRTASDIGRYAKLLFIGRQAGHRVPRRSSRARTARSPRRCASRPRRPRCRRRRDWTFEDVVVERGDALPQVQLLPHRRCACRTASCARRRSARTTCQPECATARRASTSAGTPTCVRRLRRDEARHVPRRGRATTSRSPPTPAGSIGIAYYDRIRGNLVAASKSGGAWKTTIVDGEAADGTDTGDVGIGASLFIDESERLARLVRRRLVRGGYATRRSRRARRSVLTDVVDDGLGIDGVPSSTTASTSSATTRTSTSRRAARSTSPTRTRRPASSTTRSARRPATRSPGRCARSIKKASPAPSPARCSSTASSSSSTGGASAAKSRAATSPSSRPDRSRGAGAERPAPRSPSEAVLQASRANRG